MIRPVLLAAALGLAAVTALPASATNTGCVSLDASCQTYSCPPNSVTVFNNGFTDTGPWIVICRPKV
jgi:hypothetical protein